MNRMVVIVLGAGTLVFGYASAYLYNDLQKARAESVALQARVAELEKVEWRPIGHDSGSPVAMPIAPFGPPPPDAAPSRKPATATASPPPPALVATSEAGASFTAFNTGPLIRNGMDRARMLENPEYRDALKRQRKLIMPRIYPDLQAAMQLDDQQADQLFDLLAEQQMRAMTVTPVFTAPPGTRPDPTAMRDWQAKQEQTQKDTDAAMATLLGDAGLQQWKNYQSSLPARGQVRELRSTLDSAGAPLQQDQADRLVAALAAEQQKTANTARIPFGGQLVGVNTMSGVSVRSGFTSGMDRLAFSEQMVDRQREQQQSLRAAVSPILSSQQMRELERTHASQLEMMEINVKIMREQAEAEARGETSSAQAVLAPGG